VFAEALASGLPIVGTAVGGVPEFVEHDRSGLLVPPHRPDQLAQAIHALAESPRLRAEIARRNRSHAEQTHTWDQATRRHLAIYQGLQRRIPARRVMAELPSSSW
jgi:glycosyltransferase involved in cell wall biosynthesis